MAKDSEIRWRGKEISRLEAFSDCVFAFALTLLVVSLDVPKSYVELMHAMKGFFSFGICFCIGRSSTGGVGVASLTPRSDFETLSQLQLGDR